MSHELRNLSVFLIFLALLPTIIILLVLYEAFSFPILATAGWLYVIDIIIALCLLYIFYVIFHMVLRLTNYLGQYHRVTGLNRVKYRLKIIICYGALTVPVYLAVLSLIQLSSSPKLMDYVVLFPVVLSFLISLRILANPTITLFKFSYRESPFDPLPISPEEKNTIRYIKKQVTSFFFA